MTASIAKKVGWGQMVKGFESALSGLICTLREPQLVADLGSGLLIQRCGFLTGLHLCLQTLVTTTLDVTNDHPVQGVSLVTQIVKNLPALQETQVQSLGQEDSLKKGKATHSSILAWRIPQTEEPGKLQSMGPQRVGHN